VAKSVGSSMAKSVGPLVAMSDPSEPESSVVSGMLLVGIIVGSSVSSSSSKRIRIQEKLLQLDLALGAQLPPALISSLFTFTLTVF